MSYQGPSGFRHDQPDKIGVLLTNLGTPDAPTRKALKRYLAQFLADPRVVEVPRLLWRIILHGVILRFRPKRSAAAYAKIWEPAGSPLLLHTAAQREALSERLRVRHGDDIVVAFAMRYGSPSIPSVLHSLQEQGVRKLLVLPLYPQYSASTTGSTFDAIAADFTRRRWLPDFRFVSHYHDAPQYIDAMARHIEQSWEERGQRPDQLILSYHGIPKRYLLNGDPYFCECHKTSRLLATRLGLRDDQWQTTFQSRFGREEWLKPYTDETLKQLPGQGIKKIDVFCPGFSADCLETIEEIDQENREYFMEAGGEAFHYIPALNAEPVHIDALVEILERQLKGWDSPEGDADELQKRYERAAAKGAER